MLRLYDVEANNTEQAVAYYREQLAAGTWSPDRAEALLMKQDNPDELILAMAKVKAEHENSGTSKASEAKAGNAG
jgi:hypothetical protein